MIRLTLLLCLVALLLALASCKTNAVTYSQPYVYNNGKLTPVGPKKPVVFNNGDTITRIFKLPARFSGSSPP